ncbi:HAD family hydrolase [Glaciihabitans sp. dw_435]|uniref:HAD family hydrolase n=1 Tax=Glaciihabitans sp. dw_435 TaxID=2720081 RepID=UPI001BD52079|nr:HAD family hydrolase [Glaciihabitans sp. dw_435]
MTEHATAALFDIDGTLVDSNYLHIDAWARAFAHLGVAVQSWRIHRCIGMDSSKLLEELLGDRADTLGSEAGRLHSIYYMQASQRLRAFDGARELLTELARRGVTVVLATSAPEEELALLRQTLDVEESIARVTSADDVETAKPDPDIVTVALERAQAQSQHAFFIGDTVWDVAASARAGVACIGVRSGGISEAELREAGAVAVYADVADLLAQLDASPLAALVTTA